MKALIACFSPAVSAAPAQRNSRTSREQGKAAAEKRQKRDDYRCVAQLRRVPIATLLSAPIRMGHQNRPPRVSALPNYVLHAPCGDVQLTLSQIK